MAAVFVIPGITNFSYASPLSIEFSSEEASIDSRLVEDILRQVSLQTGLEVDHLKSCYECGTLSIDKVVEGYLVTLSEADGGIGILIAEESF